jgi:hypothetical protein
MQRTHDLGLIDGLSQSLWRYVAEDDQPWVSLKSWLDDERNIAIAAGEGAFLFTRLEMGTYEVHTLFHRGAINWSKHAASWMFTHTDCIELVTKVPQFNVAAKRLTEASRFRYQFTGRTWRCNGKIWPIDFYAYRIDDWILEEPGLPMLGAAFHTQLGALGVEIDHDDDAIHDRYVGAAMAMVDGGQASKGIVYYNRWARLYGATEVELLSIEPPVVDVGTAKVSIVGGELCLSAQD